MLTIQFLCPLPNGLHARPAWELKEQCSQWQSEVTLLIIARTPGLMPKARWR